MPTIEVSPETYGKLERLVRPFKDSSEDDVIRRLAEAALGEEEQRSPVRLRYSLVGRDLFGSRGHRIRHGTILKATYKGVAYEAEIKDGKVWWKGDSFSSLSAAAVAVIRSTGSDRPTENGRRFWVQLPPSEEPSRATK